MLATHEQMIQKSPGRIGGAACIRGTRIAVFMLVEDRKLGVTDHTILTDYYPSLTAEDLKAAWDYYDSNREEIDEAIRRNNED
jgi:uncharacterized protein (DUF433 family)